MSPARRAPVGTLALIAATLAAILAELVVGVQEVVWAVGLWPAAFRSAELLLEGAGPALPPAVTLVTWVFPHVGVPQTVANLVALLFAGMLLERRLGALWLWGAYLASGVAAGLTLVALGPLWGVPFVGASGAVAGILGVLLAVEVTRWIQAGGRGWLVVLGQTVAGIVLVIWLLRWTPTRTPGTSDLLAAHAVPFMGGWLVVRLWRGARPRSDE